MDDDFVMIVVTQVKSPTLITKVNPSIKLKSFQTHAYFSLLSDKDIEALYNIYRYVLCMVNTENWLKINFRDDFQMFGYKFTFRGRNYPPNP